MELSQYFKSIIDQDLSAVVICDTGHTILYMNPAATARYARRGGEKLLGRNLLECHAPQSQELIRKAVSWFVESEDHNILYEAHNDAENRDTYIIALRDADGELIGYYEKHEFRNRETKLFYDFT